MSDSNIIRFPGTPDAGVSVAVFAPLDSRRARRERSLAAAASLAEPVADSAQPAAVAPEPPWRRPSHHEAAIARRELLTSISYPEPKATMPPDLIA